MNESNPYAWQPNASPTGDQPPFAIDPADRKKIDAIIKDAEQWWLAIFLCCLCSPIGLLIFLFWYLSLFIQWNGIAKKYPSLVEQGTPVGSVQAKFESSKWKLMTAIAFAVSAFVFLIILIVTARISD